MRIVVFWLCLAGLSAGQGVIGTALGVTQSPPRDPRTQVMTGTGSISGRVTASDTGLPIRHTLVNLQGPRRLGTYTDNEGRYELARLPSGTYRPSGTFSIAGVPPGTYQAIAQFQPPRQAGAVLAPGESGQEYGTAVVDVIAGDVEHAIVTTRPGATVTGSLVFDEPLPPGGRANVSAQPTERRTYMGTPVARVDGTTFTIRQLFGPVLVRGNASGGPASWGLKAVLLRGRDITDEPTVLSAADSGHLEVVFTAKAPSIEGVVTDEAGAPAADAIVILFGYDPETWQPRSSFTRTVRPGKDGTCTLRGLREGRYHAVAMAADPITTLSPPSAELLKEFSRFATAVTLNPGETRTVDLRVLRFEPR